ncbi:uncharacterized protein LOC134204445, partial [Armigeres subalbatus]|uniref:uncharacterized protein LOC134204445 n=1 Tax=Armigeres subalbatus TaxID=124917 RepID=UPI002ED378DE
MVVILIVLPCAPPPPSTVAPSPYSAPAFQNADRTATSRLHHQSTQRKPEFEPTRTHRIISAATAAAVRSPYRRSDDSAVSYARLRYTPWTPSSTVSPSQRIDGNNNNTSTTYQRWKRSLPERQSHKRKQWKRPVVGGTNISNSNDNNSSSNRHRLPNNSNSFHPNNLRYTSRVIISDDFPQVDIKSDDNEVEPISREEEIIKKRKTELITTRQIETRVQRQLKFEDGKVIEDSGPIVSTNTTEDTDRQETVQTEHRTLGDPTEEEVTKNAAVDSDGKPVPIGGGGAAGDGAGGLQNLVSDASGGAGLTTTATGGDSNKPKTIGAIVARPDGLLKNIKEEVEVSREETKERTVHEERKHFGDFTDD